MSVLSKIRNRISGARKKIAHAVDIAEKAGRRVDHFREVKKSTVAGTPKRARANRKLNYWTAVYKRALQAKAAWNTVLKRRIAKKHRYLKNHPPGLDPEGDGLIVVDGRQVVEWIGKILLAARQAGEWHGQLLSGYRTPEYSEQICITQVCGHPTCPGTCAGRASRHSEKGNLRGAGDVTYPWELEAYCRKHGLPLHGNGTVLPYDHNHFSHEGN